MSFSWILLAVLLLFFCLAASTSAVRNLSDIHYRFTTCGASGRNGPPLSWCRDEYMQASSPILQAEDRLFQFTDRNRAMIFRGAQGFRVPKSGLYNITVAGAAGGRGICSLGGGKGLVWRGQLDLSEEQNLLILVGQKGVGPCDVSLDANLPLCQNPPTSVNDIYQCNRDWYTWLESNPDIPNEGMDLSFNYAFTGAGGGGGASMIRIQNRTDGTFGDLPLVIAGGGGGAAANLTYDVLVDPEFSIPVPVGGDNLTIEELYKVFINAKATTHDPQLPGLQEGQRGYIGNMIDTLRAGAGGGWSTFESGADGDGEFLSVADNFALGGFDCARRLASDVQVAVRNVNGGFGGGGGQCGVGGGGGGYTGGSIFGSDVDLPGGGGYYYVDPSNKSVIEFDTSMTSDGHGYVDIVLSNCGCTNVCVIVEDTFHCDCPNDTNLAPDEFDCYQDIVQNTPESFTTPTTVQDGIIFTPLQFDRSFSLYGISSSLSMQPTMPETTFDINSEVVDTCRLFFLGRNGEVVLVSNLVSDLNGAADLLAKVENNSVVGNYERMLTTSVVVSGALIASTGNCSVMNDSLRLAISTVSPTNDIFPEVEILTQIQSGVFNTLAQQLLSIQPTTSSIQPSTENTTSSSSIPSVSLSLLGGLISLAVLIVVVIVIITVVISVLCVQYNRRRKDFLRKGELAVQKDYSSSSMSNNAAYETNNWREDTVYKSNDFYESAVPAKLTIKVNSYEALNYSNYEDQDLGSPISRKSDRDTITASARHFTPRYGISAPMHNFTSYNRLRVTDDYRDDWEYPRNKLIYLRELGEGQFGKVLLMQAQGIANYVQPLPVAVKTLSSRDSTLLQRFMDEAKLMKQFAHPNIVSLLGISSHSVSEDSAPLMILEYMPYGDLHSFLVKHRPTAETNEGEMAESRINAAHFFSFARDIAEALEFLESMKHVHRDIAARNCLVGPGLIVKLADFGMARGVHDKNYYRVEGRAMLPVKWLAPESLLYGFFSTASDVWAYGVLLWEIVTYGQLPLADLDVDEVVRQAESQKLTHSRPKNCPDDIYTVMCKCHEFVKEERITFAEIVLAFSKHNIDSIFEESLQM